VLETVAFRSRRHLANHPIKLFANAHAKPQHLFDSPHPRDACACKTEEQTRFAAKSPISSRLDSTDAASVQTRAKSPRASVRGATAPSSQVKERSSGAGEMTAEK
jgi:hypothetical protein